MEKKPRRRRGGLHRRYSIMTGILFAVAGVLLAAGAIGGTRGALLYSQTYEGQLKMQDIGVALYEGETDVSDAELLTELEEIKPGIKYDEELKVENTGTIDEYVRLIVYRYWEDKDTERDPSLIELTTAAESDGWIIDSDASTEERIVMYYATPLAPGEQTTAAVTALKINSKIQKYATQTSETTDGLTTITTTYDYDGAQAALEAEADAVQTHNAEDAILSAWGVKVTVASDGTLSLD